MNKLLAKRSVASVLLGRPDYCVSEQREFLDAPTSTAAAAPVRAPLVAASAPSRRPPSSTRAARSTATLHLPTATGRPARPHQPPKRTPLLVAARHGPLGPHDSDLCHRAHQAGRAGPRAKITSGPTRSSYRSSQPP